MKTVLVVILLIALFAGAGYYGLPILIEKETAGLRSEVQVLKKRLQKTEEFIKSEEEARKTTHLQPDADLRRVIKTVNSIDSKVTAIEDSFKKEMSVINGITKNQQVTTEEAFKKQAEAVDKISKEVEAKIQKSMFDALMAGIRGHILKVKVDLVSKNIGTAKTELGIIDEAFEKAKGSASDENKKIIEELQVTLKKIRTEIDIDLASAINRIDLLWHEMSRLLVKA